MPSNQYFTPATFGFLRDLAANNDRGWFKGNKARYEDEVKAPCIRFIADFGPHLKKISAHFRADPRPVGGSLFRIYRDVRFSKDKSPYKTAAGLHFRHFLAKDVHAPGFYLHLDPKGSFMGAGIWRPDSKTLTKIRDAIVADPAKWRTVKEAKSFTARFELTGDSLVRAPRGFDPEHPLIEDLRRKDFVASAPLARERVTSPGFMRDFTALCEAGGPLVRYLCEAVGVPY